MTAVEDRPMTTDIVKFFENSEFPEEFKVELLRGEIVMTAGPDVARNDIVEAVVDQIPRRRWRRLQTQDIAMPLPVTKSISSSTLPNSSGSRSL